MAAQDAACPVWVEFDGKQYCSPALDRAQQDIEGPRFLDVLPFDRVLEQASEEDPPAAILYADINAPFFGHFHQTLVQTAKAGTTSYRIRYRRSSGLDKAPLSINGYGVELALKRTDYIVIDDREAGKGEHYEDGEVTPSTDDPILENQDEEFADLKPLTAKELLGLGMKTSSFIMESEDPFETLAKISQDFPKHSSALTKRNTSKEFSAEHKANREILLPAGFNVIWMNGLQVETRQMDAFALLEQMRRERSLVKSMSTLGFSGKEAVQVLSHSIIAESKMEGEVQRYDFRDDIEGGKVIIWLNNIEKDKRYDGWPTQVTALLQRTFPGQMPSVRRDIHNVVLPLDMTDPKHAELLVESIQAFVKRKIPIRFGFVPIVTKSDAEDQAKLLHHLNNAYGLSAVLTYLERSIHGTKALSANKPVFDAVVSDRTLRPEKIALDFKAIINDEELSNRIHATRTYLKRLSAEGSLPPIFANGVAVPHNEGWLQAMSTRIDQDLRYLQRQIYEELLPEDTSLADHLLEKAIAHRNALIIPEDENDIKLLDIADIAVKYVDVLEKLPRVATKPDDRKPSLMIIVADLDSSEGARLVGQAAEYVKDNEAVELRILHNAAEAEKSRISVALYDYTETSGRDIDVDKLKITVDFEKALEKTNANDDSGFSTKTVGSSMAFWASTQGLVKQLNLDKGESGILFNGRVIGPIPKAETFTVNEFKQLVDFESSRRLLPAITALSDLKFQDRIETPLKMAILSSLLAISTTSDIPEGIFESAPTLRMAQFNQWGSEFTMISMGEEETATIHLVASIDPTSEVAQRWIPMLKVLSALEGVYLRLFLNPKERIQELPIKRFYRHVLDSAPTFGSDGSLKNIKATFESLPREALLNMAMDVPPAWLVSAKESIHDLDNIKISSLKEYANIDALYELEHILIEGHSRDVTLGPPPRGVQLTLGTPKNLHFADTIIMANLGYFQFKANPGYWSLSLLPGRSSQIFTIDSAGQKGYSPQPGDTSTDIALFSFQGKTLFPRLSRNAGMENEDVLEPLSATSATAILQKGKEHLSSFLSSFSGSQKALAPLPDRPADINIFSVASGHLYERMLSIMILSVLRHTKSTVKFWFIAQFLSPSFKRSLPLLAAHYSFQYELVTYKWPHWLRAQSEKQREIWGYKILFLDVLFPLNLDKVIFVDADQIVRTDMLDLVNHDLQGAAYGFTPMCDSRTEMEGFRFWKQGYWKSFLQGKPYHISALYVVDLKKFRAIAAGDRLRQQYHTLSADPNSLSNLDQDLPNHMQHQLEIHSLPQEWLWCETWCSDESLKVARTIDLCNNPETKEPKLERARRQVPEWREYDEEIAEVLRRRNANGSSSRMMEEGREQQEQQESQVMTGPRDEL